MCIYLEYYANLCVIPELEEKQEHGSLILPGNFII